MCIRRNNARKVLKARLLTELCTRRCVRYLRNLFLWAEREGEFDCRHHWNKWVCSIGLHPRQMRRKIIYDYCRKVYNISIYQETEVSLDYSRNKALLLVLQGKSLAGPFFLRSADSSVNLIRAALEWRRRRRRLSFRRNVLSAVSPFLPNTLTCARRRMSAIAIETILDALPITPAIVADRFAEIDEEHWATDGKSMFNARSIAYDS